MDLKKQRLIAQFHTNRLLAAAYVNSKKKSGKLKIDAEALLVLTK